MLPRASAQGKAAAGFAGVLRKATSFVTPGKVRAAAPCTVSMLACLQLRTREHSSEQRLPFFA
jgi:hypothetical protein